MAVLFLLIMYGTPVVILVAWAKKVLWQVFSGGHLDLIWVALILVSLSDGMFWYVLLAKRYPQDYIDIKPYVISTIAGAALTIVCALSGKGQGRWWAFSSAIGVPISWLTYAIMV